ncbi:MAG TPA: hypothetical protein VGK78_16260 [Nocardioides sp.]|uniref:hypothetical protein n=1 Tax=Nocardioides sp. TaxID=35761 RepID=UPI002F3E836C
MWIAVYLVAAIGAITWFVRTPLFRAHLRHGKDPGDSGTRVEGKFPGNGGDYYYGESERE